MRVDTDRSNRILPVRTPKKNCLRFMKSTTSIRYFTEKCHCIVRRLYRCDLGGTSGYCPAPFDGRRGSREISYLKGCDCMHFRRLKNTSVSKGKGFG